MSNPRSPSAFGVLFCMRLAAALSHRKVPIRLMCTTLAKKSPAIGPFLPSTRPAPTTPAQFTSRVSPPRRVCAPSMAALTSASEVTSQRRGRASPGSLLHVEDDDPAALVGDVARDRVAEARGAAGDDGACVLDLH